MKDRGWRVATAIGQSGVLDSGSSDGKCEMRHFAGISKPPSLYRFVRWSRRLSWERRALS